MKHYINTKVINQFSQGCENWDKRCCYPAVQGVGPTELGFGSLLGEAPNPVLVLQRSPVELGSDLGGCAPWLVRKCIETALGLLKEARGWNQLLLLSYCPVGTEMKSKQNTKKEVPSLLPWPGRALFAGENWQMRCNLQSPSPKSPNRAQRLELELRDNSPSAKWDPQLGNLRAEPEAQVRAQGTPND